MFYIVMLILAAGAVTAIGGKFPMLGRLGKRFSGTLCVSCTALSVSGLLSGSKRPGFIPLILAVIFFYMFAAKLLEIDVEEDANGRPRQPKGWLAVNLIAGFVGLSAVPETWTQARLWEWRVQPVPLLAFAAAYYGSKALTTRLRVSKQGLASPVWIPVRTVMQYCLVAAALHVLGFVLVG